MSFVLAMQGQNFSLLVFLLLSLEWKTICDPGVSLEPLSVLLALARKVCLRSPGVGLGDLLASFEHEPKRSVWLPLALAQRSWLSVFGVSLKTLTVSWR